MHASTAYVALGSNLGDRAGLLRAAVGAMAALPDTVVQSPNAVASLYESSPQGVSERQPDYLNSVVRVRTSLTPIGLLEGLLRIESAAGRTRCHTNEARLLDLDLLFFDGWVVNSPRLRLPHPRLHERLFVLEPLAEIAAEFDHPVLRRSVRELLHQARDRDRVGAVRRIHGPSWVDVRENFEAQVPTAETSKARD